MSYVCRTTLMCCGIAMVAMADSTPKKAVTSQKKTAPTPAAAAQKKVPAKSTTGTARGRYTAYRRQQPVRRAPAQQTSPTPDRYREIQEALAAKGYLKSSPTGVWDKDSMEAMQRFQQDHKLEPTGKLTARSLGALGLGPKVADALPPSTAAPAGLSAQPAQ